VRAGGPHPGVVLRRAPWPYRALLAVCSDLDETPDARVYAETARFLNTRETTAMGEGVGLEVGNSLYFDMPKEQFSYWGTDDRGREMAQALMRSGHIDAVHSWGDLATTRGHAERNLAELTRSGCRLEVWIDHSRAPSNFGPDIMCGEGDRPGAAAYHADLTLAYGIRYVWRGRTTGLVGQDVPVGPGSFLPMLDSTRPLASARSALKEAAKVVLGGLGRARWEMYAANRTLRPCRLRDGQRAWEFLRTNPSWGGPGESATAEGIADVLTPRMLDRLVDCEGSAVLYTHLGKVESRERPLGPAAVDAFRALSRRHEDGQVLVTTTHRLLRYLAVRETLVVRLAAGGPRAEVVLEAVEDPVTGKRIPTAEELAGLTFGVLGSDTIELRHADGRPVPCEVVRGGGGTAWAHLPWVPLRFPDLRL
jgi:hypothetical protein